MRSDAAKQPRKEAKESETSPRTEEELAGRKPATMAATSAALTSQRGGPLDPLWPRRFESWVILLLVVRSCGILVHYPRFCCLTQSVEQRPEVTRAALTVSLEKRTCGLLCSTFSAMSNRKHLARGVRRGQVPSGSVIPCVFRSNGSQLVHLWGQRSCQLSSSHNCRPSTVFSANCTEGCRTREANQ